MEIGTASTTRALFSLAVQKKALDTAQDQGKAAVELIEATKTPPPGTGQKLNVVA
jgi:hypothetical protein